MSKKQTEAVLGDLVGLVTKHLKKGDRIRIGGLGILQVRKRAARMGRNPATGEPIQIKAIEEGRLPRRQGTQGSGLRQSAEPSATRRRPHGRDCNLIGGSSVSRRVCVAIGCQSMARRLVGGDGLEPPTSCV